MPNTGVDPLIEQGRARRAIPPMLVVVGAALLVLGPVLTSRGFSLVGDMVFVPRQPWKDAWLGLDGSVPRAVPGDALVSVLSAVVPGDVLQKAVLFLILVCVGLGVLLLTRDLPWLAGAAAAVFAMWNPYVLERLAIGHWALLCGYAALPWAVVLAARVGSAGPRALPALVVPLAVAAWTSPSGGVLAAVLAIATAVWVSRRAGLLTLGLAAALNAPWLVVGVLNTSDAPADPFGVEAFAARADTPGGVGVSLLTGGGIWKTSVHPAERTGWFGVVLVFVIMVAVIALVGAWRSGAREMRPLIIVGVVSVIATTLLSTALGAEVATWVVTTVPGGGLLRDTQKWIAPWLIAVSVGWGHAVGELVRRSGEWGAATAGIAIIAPALALPSLAWGLGGHLAPTHYPQEWHEAAAELAAAGSEEGRTAVLPLSTYRRYAWNDDRAVLDPAPRFFPGYVVTDDTLVVEGGRVQGENPIVADLAEAAGRDQLDEAMRRQGIRFVVVERSSSGSAAAPDVPTGAVLHTGPELIVVDRGSGSGPPRTSHPTAVLLATGASAATTLIAAICLTWLHIRRRFAYSASDQGSSGRNH